MPAVQTGKLIAWASLPTQIAVGANVLKLIATEFTITSGSELEKIKDSDGDITTHVFHGHEKTARLICYPANTVQANVDAANVLQNPGTVLTLTFAYAQHPGTGNWEVTSSEIASTNTSHAVHTYELVQAPGTGT
jgi:hypothetical protein